MFAVAFIVGCLSVLGFYGYVLVQFYRGDKRSRVQRKRLYEHLHEMKPKPGKNAAEASEDHDLCSKTAALRKDTAHMRKETLIHLSLAVVGLMGLFLEIELINWLVTSLHWY